MSSLFRTTAYSSILLGAIYLSLSSSLHGQMTWSQVETGPNRFSSAAAYDSVRKRLVVFGGFTNATGVLGDTIEWDGKRWHLMRPANRPPIRGDHAMAFDTNRGRVVMFGGGYNQILDDTWEWDGKNWVQLHSTSSPAARHAHTLAYDEARKRVVLFGGLSGSIGNTVPVQDTWEWDGTNWTLQGSTVSPAARFGHGMAFDVFRRKIVLHGGSNTVRGALNAFGDTWEWDGKDWVQTSNTGPRLTRHAMATSILQAGVVIYGGENPTSGIQNLAWRWDGSIWHRIADGSRPSARSDHSMAFDPARAKVLVYGGRLVHGGAISMLWEFDNAWRLADSGAHPPGVGALVGFGGEALGFGDRTPSDSTWTFNGSQWRKLSPSRRPSARMGSGLAHDEMRDRVILFGGSDGFRDGDLGGTWEWDGSNWSAIPTTVKPPPRSYPTMTYDTRRDRVVMFGGKVKGNPIADTWEFDGRDWLPVRVTPSPPAYSGRSMVYDRRRRVVVLFGNGLGVKLGNTWEFDGRKWTLRTTPSGPDVRTNHSMVYDAARERVVLSCQSDVHGTWEYDGTDWRRAPALSPSRSGLMAYDDVRDRILVFDYANDTWIYSNQQPARATPFGRGCGGSVGIPSLGVDDNRRPWIGGTYRLTVNKVPANAPILLVSGVSKTTWGAMPLPLDLAIIGMPMCDLLASVDFTDAIRANATRATWSAQVPASISLLGTVAYQQAFVSDVSANPLGVIASNAVEVRIGGR